MTRSWCTLLVLAACGDGDPTRPDATVPDVAPVTITIMVGEGAGSFAYQDGDQPFVLATPQSGAITFTVTSGRYAFARKCNGGNTRLFYKAASETSVTFASCAPATPVTSHITGTITSAEDALHYLAHGAASSFSSGETGQATYVYALTTSGTADFIAARQIGGDAPDRLHVERDVAVGGTVTRDLTFASLATPSLTTQDIPQGAGAVFTDIITATSSVFVDDYESPFTFVAFPSAARRATDRYATSVAVDLTETSSVTLDRVVALPQPFASLPTTNLLDALTVAGTTISWNRVPDLDSTLAIVSTTSPGLGLASFSQAWSALGETQRWQVPDLGAIAGWPASGGFRGALDTLDVFVTLDEGAYPDLGYEATTYQRSYGASERSNLRRQHRRALRALLRSLTS